MKFTIMNNCKNNRQQCRTPLAVIFYYLYSIQSHPIQRLELRTFRNGIVDIDHSNTSSIVENPMGRRGPGDKHDSTFRRRSFHCRSNRRKGNRDEKWHMNQPPLWMGIRSSRKNSHESKTSDEPRHNRHLLSKDQKLHQGENLLARYIIREKGDMEWTKIVGTKVNHHRRKPRQGQKAKPNQTTTSSITSY